MKRRPWLRWLPQITFYSSAICGDEWEAEGHAVSIRWDSLVIEQFVGRVSRSFDDFEKSEDQHEI
jgi:hypothetical protein